MYNIAVVGATGLVGQTMLRLLEEKQIPIANLTLFSSARSAGSQVSFNGENHVVEELTTEKTAGPFDYVLMSAGGETSLTFSPLFEKHGAVVIDNSSAWRMDPEISLVVPEVNPPSSNRKIIANPNCSTIQSVGPLKILLDAFGIERIAYTTYQSVSGSGWKGIEDLKRGERGEDPVNYPHPIYNNVLPQIDVFQEDGYTKEEVKMIEETRKILNLPTLPVTATCVRVPVTSAHAVAINVTLSEETSVKAIQSLFEASPYVTLEDEPEKGIYPMPLQAGGKEGIFVGRIRKDDSLPNTYHVWTVSDNILKGAALNAVQILQQLIS
ncbi:aspartate-semialdehyde dehydrogenase [Marinilactibacillus kalidii]|uniref:aspartate-semialdehyde dehydrogenase n=1 Tax=Marinilactibacillus kalidii TaxID=2820274 RepID=UPI001ABDF52D|nr:aspartate-semialdehyde dehydrogenase [Marinilactibacillus kalidii]